MLKQLYISNPTTNNKKLYSVARSLKYFTLDTIIRDHLERRDFTSLDQILQADSEMFAKRARIGLKILQTDYNGARTLISNYQIVDPSDQDFLDIQSININRLESGSLSSSDQASLQSFIDSRSLELSYARAILSHERDSIYEPETGDVIITPRSFEDAIIENSQQLMVIPNPSTGMIELKLKEVSLIDKIVLVSVISIEGRLVVKEQFQSNNILLDLSNVPTGIYMVRIYDNSMDRSFTTKLVLLR